MGIKAVRIAAAAVCAALTVGSAFSLRANASDIIDNGDFKYIISEDGKSAEIISYVGQSLYVTIPGEVDNHKIVSIGAAAFKDNKNIKEVEFSPNIKNIEVAAFEGCTHLEKIQIPGNIRVIEDSAFSGCKSLSNVKMDDGIENIGAYAFSECSSLKKLRLPNSLNYIGDYAFVNCTGLEDPGIPKALKYFGGYALENTKWMNSQKGEFVTVGDGILVKYQGDSTVKSIPGSIKTIGSHSFAGNNRIKNIMLSSSVNLIESSAFENCASLSDIYIPSSVSQIGSRAFFGCKALRVIDIPKNLNMIDDYVFSGSSIESVSIPQSVSTIGISAFSDCKGLRQVELCDGLNTIKENAFSGCVKLRRMIFPLSLKEIEKNAFDGCQSLSRVEFNGNTKLEDNAFNDCPNLTEAVFYKNPDSIGDTAFNQANGLIIYSDNNMYLSEYASRNGKGCDTIKNLQLFNENQKLELNEEKGEGGFSSGYTFVTILIILIDLALVSLFSVYILFIEPKSRRSRNARLARQAAEKRERERDIQHHRKPARRPPEDKAVTKKPVQPRHREEPRHRADQQFRTEPQQRPENRTSAPKPRPVRQPVSKHVPQTDPRNDPDHYIERPPVTKRPVKGNAFVTENESVTVAGSEQKKKNPRSEVKHPISGSDVVFASHRPKKRRSDYNETENDFEDVTYVGFSGTDTPKRSPSRKMYKSTDESFQRGDTMIFDKPDRK